MADSVYFLDHAPKSGAILGPIARNGERGVEKGDAGHIS
jgi:hypothetical protein